MKQPAQVRQRLIFDPDAVDLLDARGRVMKRTTAQAVEQLFAATRRQQQQGKREQGKLF